MAFPYGGTGLRAGGLAICAKLAGLMGGEIGVAREGGQIPIVAMTVRRRKSRPRVDPNHRARAAVATALKTGRTSDELPIAKHGMPGILRM
jgi:hypothetical protein